MMGGGGTISFYSLEIKQTVERPHVCHLIGPLDDEATAAPLAVEVLHQTGREVI